MCYTVKDHGKKYISFLEDTLIPKRKDKSRLVKFSLFSFFSVIIVFMFNVFVLLSSKTITHWKSNISYIFRRYFSLKILKVDNNSKQSFVNQNAQLEKRWIFCILKLSCSYLEFLASFASTFLSISSCQCTSCWYL